MEKNKDFKHDIEEVDSSVNPMPLNRIENILGMFQTVTTAPTATPTTFHNQIQIHINGGTLRLYVYDTVNNTWRYASLT